ncbi:metal-binding protein [Streptomyces sp. CB02923]|uniref:CHAD domain-containing protein n=1 Tax=Streptomyces sp. CB02923 TaxID=1718985 RepID=UPI000964E34A|nr:CHAD domain-containing protein [Streptomyces sp. CB02923]OKI10109.1 metal-binding protein [Streptomyces sp. CB02923]
MAQRHDFPPLRHEPAGPGGAPAAVADGPARPGAQPRPAGRPRPYGTDGSALTGRTARDVLAAYLHHQAADFLRSLRSHRESGPDAESTREAARHLRSSARRIGGALHTFRPLMDEKWADHLRGELAWLSGTLAREHASTERLDRLLGALQRLTGRGEREEREERTERGEHGDRGSRTNQPSPPDEAEALLSAGAARAGALLERQITLARTRAHSAALQALGSSRFHAVADAVAVLASEAPLAATADRPAAEVLLPLAEQAHRRLAEAVAALPLARAGHAYADARTVGSRQDASWHQVRLLARLSRYAQEVSDPDGTDPRLAEAGRALERHRDAAEAAGAAAAAARTPRIAPATAYALGVLHADQRHEVEAARFVFGRSWLSAPVPEPVLPARSEPVLPARKV